VKEVVFTEVGITCPHCDWGYKEPVAVMPIPLVADPETFEAAIADVMHQQRLERIAAVVTQHFRECHPHLARVQ
jgi:hypothetical protein